MKVRSEQYRFSWSLRRRRLWNGCRRRYFLTYYAPRGGHDPAAEPALRRLHLAKSLFSRDGYCNYLLRTTMRELFYRRNEEEDTSTAPDLRSRVLHAFARDFNRMLLGFWQEDHRVPMLRELLQSGADVDPEWKEWDNLNAFELFRAHPESQPTLPITEQFAITGDSCGTYRFFPPSIPGRFFVRAWKWRNDGFLLSYEWEPDKIRFTAGEEVPLEYRISLEASGERSVK